MFANLVTIAASLATVASALATLVTACLVYRQLVALRKDLHGKNITDLVSKWNAVSQAEMENPAFHRMLLGPRAREATKYLSDRDMAKRAFAHFVLDVLTGQHRLRREAGISVGTEAYLELVFSNPEMQKMWFEYEIREAWETDPFVKTIDEICKRHENSQKEPPECQSGKPKEEMDATTVWALPQ